MNQPSVLTEWLPDKNSFKYIDDAIVSPRPVDAMAEEREVRIGWMTHPQIGIDEKQSLIDIGARYGEYTLTALALGCRHVYAFEKDPRLVKLIRENLRVNGHSFIERCSVLNRTVSPIGMNIDNYIFNECSAEPRNLKWIVVDVGGQDEINIIEGCYKTIEHYRPISVLIHHYDKKGPQILSERFLAANSFDCKMVAIKHKDLESEECFSTTLIY
jgi:precorrin-6B methylase 2